VSKLCERPGCSDVGAAEYGMVPEELLFWIASISARPSDDQNVLCRRHADAMSVPRGWTLDDRREATPRLFMPARFDTGGEPVRRAPRRRRVTPTVEQLMIDGTGEIERPDLEEPAADLDVDRDTDPTPWEPMFDHDDDLGGLLEVSSPLLSRAFRGGERRTS